MTALPPIDWAAVFTPAVHPLEIFVRGSVVFLFIFAVLRISRRQVGSLGISDLLVIVLIADAAQNAMASDYKSITDGLVLISTILSGTTFSIFWLTGSRTCGPSSNRVRSRSSRTGS